MNRYSILVEFKVDAETEKAAEETVNYIITNSPERESLAEILSVHLQYTEVPQQDACKCGAAPRELHGCPYCEDVGGDYTYQCNCCAECEGTCADDI